MATLDPKLEPVTATSPGTGTEAASSRPSSGKKPFKLLKKRASVEDGGGTGSRSNSKSKADEREPKYQLDVDAYTYQHWRRELALIAEKSA